MPAYFITRGRQIAGIWSIVVLATAGALAGTIFGERSLKLIPEQVFRRVVAILLVVLGAYMIFFAGGRPV